MICAENQKNISFRIQSWLPLGLNCPAWENLAEMATKMTQMGKDMVMTSSED
jgi:hypothetical protein